MDTNSLLGFDRRAAGHALGTASCGVLVILLTVFALDLFSGVLNGAGFLACQLLSPIGVILGVLAHGRQGGRWALVGIIGNCVAFTLPGAVMWFGTLLLGP